MLDQLIQPIAWRVGQVKFWLLQLTISSIHFTKLSAADHFYCGSLNPLGLYLHMEANYASIVRIVNAATPCVRTR